MCRELTPTTENKNHLIKYRLLKQIPEKTDSRHLFSRDSEDAHPLVSLTLRVNLCPPVFHHHFEKM